MHNTKTRAVVTGGAGFIGSHIVDRLVTEGFNVKVIDNLSTGKLSNIKRHIELGKVNFTKGDVRDTALVKGILQDVDVVFHLAATTGATFSVGNPDLTFDVNVGGTASLLVAAAEAKVPKFVFTSTCGVYGNAANLPVDENNEINPISVDSKSKAAAERFCMGFNEKNLLKASIFRLFNVYGPRENLCETSGVIAKFFDCSKKGLPLPIYGDGSQTRDFVHVYDVADAIIAASERNDMSGHIFNVGFGKPISVIELAHSIFEITNKSSGFVYLGKRPLEIEHIFADIHKAHRILGYKPNYGLTDGLKTLVAERGGSALA